MPSPAPHLDRIVVAAMPCIALAGPDARQFAQVQFSADVDRLAANHWQWNAWLDAKGRMRALLQLVDAGNDRLLAVLRGGNGSSLTDALRRYLLRARATLEPQRFDGRWGEAAAMGEVRWTGSTLTIGLGERSLRLEPSIAAATPDPAAANAWCLEDIRCGWPTLPPEVPPLLPQALGLGRLGAVSLAKGCYPGQEIVARIHYRGRPKQCLQRIRGTALLPIGPVVRPGEPGPGYVLATARTDVGTEALIVSSVNAGNEINIMDDVYDVISIFDT